MKYSRKAAIAVAVSALLGVAELCYCPRAAAKPTASSTVVISQVYGGGGNSGATYKNDFIELFNKGTSTVNLNGWTLQYAAATGTFSNSNTIALSGTLAPGRYYLVQLGSSGSNGADLPAANSSSAINMAAAAGKVALVAATALVTGSTDVNVVDFVGYGSANDYEGNNYTLAPSATTSVSRNNGGCSDTDNNRTDFTVGTVVPRNTSSPSNNCGAELTAAPTTLANFVTTTATASDEQSYVLSGTGLGSAVTISASAGYQITLTAGGPYSSGITTPSPTNGSISVNVYVVLDGSAVGTVTGSITNSSGATTATVTVSGTVNAPVTSAQLVRWDGGAGTSYWFDAANWTTDAVPTATADVVLDHTLVAGSYRVLLQSAATGSLEPSVSIQSLTVNPGSGDSIFFEIPAANVNGSALTITRSGANEVALAIYNKGVVTNGTGSGAGATTGAGLTVANSSPTVYIYNGGTYRHYTNRGHAVVVDNLAPVSGTENGRWEFRVTGTSSSTLSLSNRSYPTLVLRNNLTAPATSYTGSGAALTVRGRLVLGPNVTFAPNITGDFKVAGDIVMQGILRLAPTSSGNPATGRLVLNGSAPQTISGTPFGATSTGSYLGSGVTLQLYNAAGVTLATPLTVNGTLQLTAGQLTTDANNILTLAAGASVSAGGASSFVNGPVAYVATGPATLLFPIGRSTGVATAYRPLTLSITTLAVPTTFVATQSEGKAGGTLLDNLTRVSAVRYFTITPTPVPAAGAFAGTVTLSYGADDQVTNPEATSFVVAKNSGSGWENIGRSAYAGTTSTGMLTSGTFTSFSQFALASTSPSTAQNPLPVELTSFAVQRTAAGAALRWSTATEINCRQFEVWRSTDGHSFVQVGNLPGHGTTTQPHVYSFPDATVGAGETYYRLRQLDVDGRQTESPVQVLSAVPGSMYFYPNPVAEQLIVYASAPAALRILNDVGQIVYCATAAIGTTSHAVPQLPAGVYTVEMQVAGQLATRQKLVKAK